MSILTTTIGQIMVLFSFIFLGFVVAKLKAIPENSATVLSKLENNLFVPALVLGTFISNFTVEKFETAWRLFIISFLINLIMVFLAMVIAKWCSKEQYIRNIYTYGLAFSNFGFMGNAVVKAVFPELFLDYLIYTMPLWAMIYIWGVPCLLIPSEEGSQTIKSRLKSFTNPMFVAMILGMIIGLCGIRIPTFLSTVIDVTGECMSAIAMMLTGITIANMNVRKVLAMKSIYVVSFLRLLVLPSIFLGVFTIFPMAQNIVVTTICALAMPLGLSTIVIPGGYGKDTPVAAGMAVVSHLFSAITIPVIFYLMMNVLL